MDFPHPHEQIETHTSTSLATPGPRCFMHPALRTQCATYMMETSPAIVALLLSPLEEIHKESLCTSQHATANVPSLLVLSSDFLLKICSIGRLAPVEFGAQAGEQSQ
jgi:hypothetical protein